MIGLVALITITGTLIALRYDWLTQTPETKHLLWILLSCSAARSWHWSLPLS